ncbi:hypothetical protein LDVICp131 [lymphocystis disease virus-China]|uniref:Uncharacterized protein n=2 Tax=Lymphocystis disease virus 2 TaxID=159183 RepID=A0A6F8WZR2_9VIRU|nr:hypothetical protein LDVICp131 [lymphocystis disease virus-China]AAU10976.1 hypothetical protein [lymphocystis disease virus-China]BCB67487.1 hypothetical protein [Lymphocystis disease virus 2]
MYVQYFICSNPFKINKWFESSSILLITDPKSVFIWRKVRSKTNKNFTIKTIVSKKPTIKYNILIIDQFQNPIKDDLLTYIRDIQANETYLIFRLGVMDQFDVALTVLAQDPANLKFIRELYVEDIRINVVTPSSPIKLVELKDPEFSDDERYMFTTLSNLFKYRNTFMNEKYVNFISDCYLLPFFIWIDAVMTERFLFENTYAEFLIGSTNEYYFNFTFFKRVRPYFITRLTFIKKLISRLDSVCIVVHSNYIKYHVSKLLPAAVIKTSENLLLDSKSYKNLIIAHNRPYSSYLEFYTGSTIYKFRYSRLETFLKNNKFIFGKSIPI